MGSKRREEKRERARMRASVWERERAGESENGRQ